MTFDLSKLTGSKYAPVGGAVYKIGKMTVVEFPQSWVALHEEVQNHPALLARLVVQQDKDPYVQLADIFEYCGMVVDGNYTQEEVEKLLGIATQKLKDSRKAVSGGM